MENTKFYATVMPFVGEVYLFNDEESFDKWLAYEDDMSKWNAELGEANTERRIPITGEDVKRLFLDCDPEIIPDEEYTIMFSALVQRSAILTIKARARLALNNVAPLTGQELKSVIPMVRFAEASK